MARLEYYIIERTLRGMVGGRRVHFYALSGGGGARRGEPLPTEVVNNPYFEGQKSKDTKSGKHIHGGPIPPGWYWILHSNAIDTAKHGPCVRLAPMRGNAAMGRGGFLIHGRGPHGSDGCIVPMIKKDELRRFIAALDHDGGGSLYVDESVEGYRFA